MNKDKELNFTVFETDGSVTHSSMLELPERYDLTRVLGRTIAEFPFFTSMDGKPAKAFYNSFSATYNKNATEAYYKQYAEKYHNTPKSKLFGPVVVVTGDVDMLAEINWEL